MPKRVQPRWGRLGMVCVRGASQTDDDMVERGITPGEYGRGDRGCRFSDKQLDSLVVHLNSSGVSIPPDRGRMTLDSIREFLLKGLLQDAQVPTQRERNAALAVLSKRMKGLLATIRALSRLPDWHLVEVAPSDEPSPVWVFTTLPSRLHYLASMARAGSQNLASTDGERALLASLSSCADDLADSLFSLDFTSQDDVLKGLPWTEDYTMDSLEDVNGLTKRLAILVEKVRDTGRKRGGPRPFRDMRQTIFWLGKLFEACGGKFTHTPRKKTNYDGEPHSAGGRFVLEFLQMCDEEFTPQEISNALAEVIHYRNKAQRDKIARGGSF